MTKTQRVLERAWKYPFTTKSDFAREEADFVALAASEGYITTKVAAGLHENVWKITDRGLTHLYRLKGITTPPPKKASKKR